MTASNEGIRSDTNMGKPIERTIPGELLYISEADSVTNMNSY